jgi:hypothetical protein
MLAMKRVLEQTIVLTAREDRSPLNGMEET